MSGTALHVLPHTAFADVRAYLDKHPGATRAEARRAVRCLVVPVKAAPPLAHPPRPYGPGYDVA